MIELALCIGIIAFAMVAIMGVLPLGLSVQKQNREDTIIDQEGQQWINILKNGQGGWGDLTNYLDYVLVNHQQLGGNGVGGGGSVPAIYGFRGPFFNDSVPNPNVLLTTANDIVGMLTLPTFEADSGVVYSNRITAVFRSISGAQNAQIRGSPGVNSAVDENQFQDSFRYQMDVELTPAATTPSLDMTRENPSFTNLFTLESIQSGGWLNAYRLDPDNVIKFFKSAGVNRVDTDPLAATLYDLRLTFRWPVFKVGDEYRVGPGVRTLRTQVSGRPIFTLYQTNRPSTVYWPSTPIRPRKFDRASINRDPRP
ncbi:MAG: hypothetical protein JNL10_10255 [Verrucomicrobiales bacterium]|nr:hypothetical protein [Verrucomicrobiales bacterium]